MKTVKNTQPSQPSQPLKKVDPNSTFQKSGAKQLRSFAVAKFKYLFVCLLSVNLIQDTISSKNYIYKILFLINLYSSNIFTERRHTNKYLNLATAKERSCLDQPFLKVEKVELDISTFFYSYFLSINNYFKWISTTKNKFVV